MKSVVLTLIAAALSFTAVEQKPNFSGTWRFDEARSEHRATADKLTVTQTEHELTLHQFHCCHISRACTDDLGVIARGPAVL